jgi:hypothetical protein
MLRCSTVKLDKFCTMYIKTTAVQNNTTLTLWYVFRFQFEAKLSETEAK